MAWGDLKYILNRRVSRTEPEWKTHITSCYDHEWCVQWAAWMTLEWRLVTHQNIAFSNKKIVKPWASWCPTAVHSNTHAKNKTNQNMATYFISNKWTCFAVFFPAQKSHAIIRVRFSSILLTVRPTNYANGTRFYWFIFGEFCAFPSGSLHWY